MRSFLYEKQPFKKKICLSVDLKLEACLEVSGLACRLKTPLQSLLKLNGENYNE